jgi:hypothetical protein
VLAIENASALACMQFMNGSCALHVMCATKQHNRLQLLILRIVALASTGRQDIPADIALCMPPQGLLMADEQGCPAWCVCCNTRSASCT